MKRQKRERKTTTSASQVAAKIENIGWLKIITTIFNSENALIITSITAVSSAIVYAIAYLYQCSILRSWNIPIETIEGAGGKTALYYVVFGILYALSAIVTQVIVRHISLDAAIARRLYKVVKRSLKSAKKSTKPFPKLQRKKYQTTLTDGQRRLKRNVQKIVGRTTRRSATISVVLLIPFYAIFQMLATDATWVLLLPTSILMSMMTIISGFIQANILLPPSVRDLLAQSKKLDKNIGKANEVLERAVGIISEWLTDKKSGGRLSEIWNTVSRIDVYSAICGIVAMAILLVAMGNITPKVQTSFWIIEDPTSQETYAAVYFSGDKVVLKQASIAEDEIHINLNNQVYAPYENMRMAKARFRRVFLDS